MNKFNNNHNGGMPLVLDDFRWMDAAYREAFLGIWRTFATNPNESFVLTGCTMSAITPGTTVNSGFIYLYGEICKVDTHTIPAGSGTSYWDIDSDYDVSGDKTFADSTNHSTYEIRTAKVFRGSVSPGTKLIASTNHATIHDKIVAQSPRKTAIVDIGIWDMDTDLLKTFAHGLNPTTQRILDIQVVLFSDADITTRAQPMFYASFAHKASITSYDATDVTLTHDSGSIFNSTSYNNNSDSRGYAIITFEPMSPNY